MPPPRSALIAGSATFTTDMSRNATKEPRMLAIRGHRGWINCLAVAPGCRRQGVARQMMAAVEDRLRRLGCAKINLQVRPDNADAIAFYQRIGFAADAVVNMGKRLERDDG